MTTGRSLRPITPDDLPECVDVFYESLEELHTRRGEPPMPRNPAAMLRLFEHLAETDPDRSWLAEDAVGDEQGGRRTAAFGIAVEREDHWFLSFLFVRPDVQAAGVGRELLERCLPPAARTRFPTRAEGVRLGTIVEAFQPVSTALYASFGLVPRTPIHLFSGRLLAPLPGLPDGVEARAFDDLAGRDGQSFLASSLDRLDRSTLGYARPADHAALARWGRRGFLFVSDGAAIGYGYAQESGRLGPVLVPEASLLPRAVGHLTRVVSAVDAWEAFVPGPAMHLYMALLERGMRIDGSAMIYCGTRAGPPFERYLPASPALL